MCGQSELITHPRRRWLQHVGLVRPVIRLCKLVVKVWYFCYGLRWEKMRCETTNSCSVFIEKETERKPSCAKSKYYDVCRDCLVGFTCGFAVKGVPKC